MWGMETNEEHRVMNTMHEGKRPCLSHHATGECTAAKLGRTCNHSHDTPYSKKDIDIIKKFHARRGKMKIENPKGDGKGKGSKGKCEKGNTGGKTGERETK